MSDFEWPWEYSFAPFFTRQPHEETRKRQLKLWCDLFLKYLRHSNKYNLNVNENSCPLFYNESVNRRLSAEMIMEVLELLKDSGHAHPLDMKRYEWQVHWYTLDEYANMISEWVQETGQMGAVCTLYEIINGDNTQNTQLHSLDEAVLMRALRLLEEREKCELIEMDGTHGVKFF